MKTGKQALMVAALILFGGCASDDTALRVELDRLKQENAELQKENASLKRKLKSGRRRKDDSIIRLDDPGKATSSRVHIHVLADGSITLDGEEMSLQALSNRLSKSYSRDPKTMVVIRTEPSTPYDQVVQVIDIVSGLGFSHMSLENED